MSADERDVLAAEDRFFGALLAADGAALDRVLADDFMLIDVMAGSEVPRAAMIDSVGSRQLVFDAVERAPGRVRQYGSAAVVTGETRMRGRLGDQPFSAHSRYSHVYVKAGETWRLASAQGTQIALAHS